MTPDALRHLQDLRRQLLEPPTAPQPDAVEEAAVDAETAAA
jgi:hypothetical protein